ncbi:MULTISPECIES: FadR/GntR family transcriptional regulator [Synergistaceae]|jgi:GntR family transcriptional regulator, transcriptional repressor for pyruvate dehydrogenase complex|uniref:FadR/GntR family transcriptional regulator n=1 Tax=Synergistaceae TaxID=649777 RepID=UPI003AEBE8FF|nr:FadR family transcriptional regulator [Synergistaceae bacterium DZ-S4]
MIETQVSRGTRIYEKVVEKLKESISKGEILPGDPLPSERQLMDDFGVSRSSLREAFRVMELLGLIESVPGKGRFVRHPKPPAEDEKNIRLEDSAVLELMEARRILDPAIAAESAMRATSSDLTRLLRVLTSTEKRLGDPNQRAQSDFDFHLALAEATHNFVFVNITRMNFDLIMATHDKIYNLLDDKEAFLAEHREMYEAILDHNVELAREMASNHIDRIYKTLHKGIAAQ